MDDFAEARPQDVVRRGNEWFVDADAVTDVIAEATRRGVKVLGLEGFLIEEHAVYPALSRIADFSDDTSDVAAQKAIALLRGDWSERPKAADQMHSEANGRHMIAVVLAG